MSLGSWVPLRNRSYYTLLKGASKPIRLAERAVQLGMSAIALTDEGSITGSIAFIKALKDTCSCGHHKNSHGENVCYGSSKSCVCTMFSSAKIKPIIGCEFRLRQEDQKIPASITVLAKNLAGWKSLISAVSEANRKENIYQDKPYIHLDKLAGYASSGNWVGYAGTAGSEITNVMFPDIRQIYLAESVPAARKLVSGENYSLAKDVASRYQDIFGKGNFYLSTELLDRSFAGGELLTRAVRWISQQTGIPCLATANTHYAYPDDAEDQRLLVCTDLETDFNEVGQKIAQRGRPDLLNFFKSDSYYLPSGEEISGLHEADEVKNSLLIAEQCETYNVLSKPILPTFDCPGGQGPDQYLKKLCVDGWQAKIAGKVEATKLPRYKEQIREELSVIQGAGLSSYFLIVADYTQWAVNQGQLIGPGRGSAAGSLISYLTNITKIDPVKYGLMFERFYNAGRNTEDRISLPDIDQDFSCRDDVIEYVRNKYGREKVGNMVTFARIQGKGALKEVFRRKFSDIPLSEVERITKALPDESAISDKLQEMKEAGEEPSIIMWALENSSKDLKEFCYIDDKGNLQGEYSAAFRQAIRLEGTKKSQGKHPSGIAISQDRLAGIVPMLYDKSSGELIAGFEMNDLEATGCVKLDILQIDVLTKLKNVAKMLSGGNLD